MSVPRRVSVLAFSVALGAAGLPALPAVPAADAAVPRPAAVSGLAAFQLHRPVTLRWTNPRGADADVVRITRGTHAPTPSTGRAVTLAHARTNHVVLRDLDSGRRYSVSVWTRGAGGRSARTATTFTTKAPPPASPGFEGLVTDEADHPLRNAQVVIETLTQGVTHARTDAAGHFFGATNFALVTAVGPHATGGTSDATGYGQSAQKLAEVGDAVHLMLPAGGQVRGRVTDAAGHPVPGLAVTPGPLLPYLWPDDGGFGVSFALDVAPSLTNRNGYYTLRGVAPTATVPCVATTPTSGAFAPRCANSSVAPALGTTASAPTIVVEHGRTGTLTGTVTDAKGAELPHATVHVIWEGTDADTGRTVTTDARGRYRAANLTAGRYFVCAGRSGGLGYLEKCAELNLQGATQRSFALRPAGALSGVVRGPSGQGVGGVVVVARGQNDAALAVSRPDGSYTVPGLATGSYQLCFDPSSRSAYVRSFAPSCPPKKIALTSGRDRIGGDGTLALGGAITGVVRTASGTPVANAEVTLDRLRNGRVVGEAGALADGRGRFAAGGLAAGRYRVCAAPQNIGVEDEMQCSATLFAVTAGHTTRAGVARLVKHPSVHVHVTDASGHPLSGVDIALLKPCTGSYCTALPVFGARGTTVIDSRMTDSAGDADFPAVAAGRYGACALAYYGAAASVPAPTGYADKCTDAFPLQASATTPGSATLQLDAGGVVTGRVVDSTGHGIRDVLLHIAGATTEGLGTPPFDLGPSPFDDLRTDSRGDYTIHSVRPGQRSVCATASGYQRGCLAGGVPVAAATVSSADPLTLTARAVTARPSRPLGADRYELVRTGLGSGLGPAPFEALVHALLRFRGAEAALEFRPVDDR